MKKEKESFFSEPAKKMFTDNAGKVYHFNVDDYLLCIGGTSAEKGHRKAFWILNGSAITHMIVCVIVVKTHTKKLWS